MMGDETGCLYVARDWLLYVSERQSYSGLKNNAPALSISPRGTWTVTHGSSETTGRVFLHPPNVERSGHGFGVIALWPLPCTPLSMALYAATKNSVASISSPELLDCKAVQKLIALFPDLLKGHQQDWLAEAIGSIEVHVTAITKDLRPPDTRAMGLATLLRRNFPSQGNLGDHAQKLGLSKERLRHVFVHSFNLRISQYIAWLKLHATLTYACSSLSKPTVTEAALAGEFFDAAHLANATSRMFATRPSETLAETFHFVAVPDVG